MEERLIKILTISLTVIVGGLIMINTMGEGITELQASGNVINETEAPLAGLYASNSALMLIFVTMAFVAVLLVLMRLAKIGE